LPKDKGLQNLQTPNPRESIINLFHKKELSISGDELISLLQEANIYQYFQAKINFLNSSVSIMEDQKLSNLNNFNRWINYLHCPN
jgi:hypothetical protein